MNTKEKSSLHASSLQITLRVTLISFFAALVTFAAVPVKNQIAQRPARAGVAPQSAHRNATVSESTTAPKRKTPRKSERVEISSSRQRVSGREIAGFSARQSQTPREEESLTAPTGLKPVEQEAWLAMARRHQVSSGTGLASFYPAHYGEAFVVEGGGVRVAALPVGGTDTTAHVGNDQVIYRNAYPETDSLHVVSAGRSEEFLFLQDECAPREFAYELSELSAGTRVELVNGEVRFTNKSGQGVKIEAPWLIEASGKNRTDAVHWELDASKSPAGRQRLRLVVTKGLRYPVVIDPSWTTTGGMPDQREWHTSTLLLSGKVLVVGGHNLVNGYLASAELYDPITGSWSFTGSLGTARDFHTATLLPNGKVLVAAGQGSVDNLNSAELYDPATGTWSTTGSLVNRRYGHTATLLPSGKVLVTGGWYGAALNSAELYDPTTGVWQSGGTLGTGRVFHTATLLPSGKVLVIGGSDGRGNCFSSAELYDPAGNTWTPTGSMGAAREKHTVTLLPDGKVLVIGGRDGFVLGWASCELYDPASGTWTVTASLPNAVSSHTATLLSSGEVLVAGGANLSFSPAELYDPTSATWTATGSLETARHSHTATLLPIFNGRVLVAGGFNGSYLSSAELYEPGTGLWTATGSLITARYLHTATLLPTGEVLAAGGFNSSNRYLNSAELYDPAMGTWAATGNLGTARAFHTATVLPNGKVLVASGSNDNARLTSAELYDPVIGSWSNTGSLNTPREFHTATLLPNGKVLVAGGTSGSPQSSVEVYNPGSGTWTGTGSLATARYSHTATLLPSGKVLVAGGTSGTNDFSSAELYDPSSGTWTGTGSLATARYSHTATLLPNGKVLVAGGRNSSGYLTSGELYDPGSETWTATDNLGTARDLHTATLLPNGKVLVVAGGQPGDTASAELYDPGLGFNFTTQPLLGAISPPILPSGGALTASGSRFKGISEGSGGNAQQNSSSNYPLVQLLSLVNEQTLFPPVDATTGWSDTSFTSTPITLMTNSSSGFPVGYALATVFTNGIPSASQFVSGATPAPAPTPTPTPTCPTGGYNYVTATAFGALLQGTADIGNHCDDCTTGITFPFSVFFYGTMFDGAVISSNGNLQFTSNNNYSGFTCPLPDPNVQEAIFPYMDDLRTDQVSPDCAGECGVFTSTMGTAPNRQFMIEWRAGFFNRRGRASFAIAFYENTPSFFDILYGDIQDLGSNGDSGVQASATGPATTFSCRTPTLFRSVRVRYTLACPSPSPTATAIAPATATATATATFTPTPTPEESPTPTPAATAMATATATATATPTATATATATPTATPTPCPTLVAPKARNATSVTFSSFTANWNSVSGASGYRLDVSTSNTFTTYVPGYQDLDVGNVTSFAVTGLSANTTYFYRVRAYNGCATSRNSNVKNVKTLPCTPAAPNAQNATNVTASSFTANWSGVSGAAGYRLDVSTSNTFTTFVSGYQNLDVGNVTSYNVTGLNANTTYYYRLRAYNGCDISANSNVKNVKTKR